MLAVAWAAQAGGTDADYASAVATLADGSAIITGAFSGTAGFGGTRFTSQGSDDLFVAKVNPNGSYAWAVRAGGSGQEQACGVSALADGSAFVTGVFQGIATFGSTTLTASDPLDSDVFVAKVNPDGTFAWAVRGGGSGYDIGRNASTLSDGSGSVIVTGWFSGSATFGGTTLVTTGTSLFIAKLDRNGTYLWATQVSGGNAFSNGISTFPDGSAIVTGSLFDTATFGATTLTSAGDTDVFIAKINPNGTFAWAKRAGSSESDAGSCVAALPDGSALVAGSFRGTTAFGGTSLTSRGSSDLFIAKLTPTGDYAWVRQAGGAGFDGAGDVSALPDGSAVVTGRFGGWATFAGMSVPADVEKEYFVATLDADGSCGWLMRVEDPLEVSMLGDRSVIVAGVFFGTTTLDGETLTSQGGGDVLVAKLHPNGKYAWALQSAGPGGLCFGECAPLADGSMIVTGGFSGTVSFGTIVLTSAGLSDIFIAKMNPNGSYAWAVRAGGTSSDFARAVSVLADGSAIITGEFYGSAQFGGVTLSQEPDGWPENACVAKLSPNGTFVWARKLMCTGTAYARAISTLADGSALVAGDFYGSLTLGGTTLVSVGNYDVFVTRLYSNGSHAWAVRAGGSGEEHLYGMATLADGSAIVTGDFQNVVTFGGTSLGRNGGYGQSYVAKLGSGGAFVWAVPIQADAGNDASSRAVAVLADGSAFVTGSFYSRATFGATVLTSAGYHDIFVTKVNPNGSYAWAVRAGGEASRDSAYAIATTADGSALLTGVFDGTATFGDTTLKSAGTVPYSVSKQDVFVAKVNPAGGFVSAERIGGLDDDYAIDIEVGADGSAVVTGVYTGTATVGGITLTGRSNESFIARIEVGGFVSLRKVGLVDLGTHLAGYALLVNGRVIPVTRDGRNASTSNPGNDWVAVLARQVGAGYQLLWKNTRTGGYMSWALDATGARTSESGLTLAQVQAIEAQVNLDITGDGYVGTPIPFTRRRTVGAVEFGTIAKGYALRVNGRVIAVTRNGANASSANPGGGWLALLGRASGSGYELVWKNTRTGGYTSWMLNAAGARQSESPLVLPKVWGIETDVNFDFTGDGKIGAPQQGTYWWEKKWSGRYELMGVGSRVEITLRNLGAGPRAGTYRVEYLIRFPGDPPAVVDPRSYLTGEGSGTAIVNVASNFSISGLLAGRFTRPIPVVPNQPPQYTSVSSCSFEIYSNPGIAGSVMGSGYATNWFVT